MAKDPILFWGHDSNLYRYAADVPVHITDPNGLDVCLYDNGFHLGVAVTNDDGTDSRYDSMTWYDYACQSPDSECFFSGEGGTTVSVGPIDRLGDMNARSKCFSTTLDEDRAAHEYAKEHARDTYRLFLNSCRNYSLGVAGAAGIDLRLRWLFPPISPAGGPPHG
jgi:hypothetical protein